MPRLPDRTSLGTARPRASQPILGGVQPLEAEALAGRGQALANLGVVGMVKSDEMARRKSTMAAIKAESEGTIALIQAQEQFKDDPDYETLVPRYRETVAERQKQILSGVNDPDRRTQLEAQFAVNLERGASQMSERARSREIDVERSNLNNLIATNRESALSTQDEAVRGQLIQSAMDAIDTGQENGYLSAQDATKVRQQFTLDYAMGAASMLGPQETIDTLSGDTTNTVYDFIPADTKFELIERARTKVKQNQALLRTELGTRVKDATASYLQGLDYENPPSREEFVNAYDKDGEARYEQFQKTRQLGADISLLSTASPEDRQAILARRDPRKEVTEAGFAADFERFGALVNAVQGIDKQLADDPATYVLRHSDDARSLFAQMEQNPELAGDYAIAVIAEQERLGAPQPKLLPQKYADAIVAQFGKVEEGGENAVDMITSLADQWGEHWPTVYRQLSKDLPGAALVIGAGVDRATGERLARIANLSTADLKKGLVTTEATAAAAEIQGAMAGFRNTMIASGGSATFNTVYEQAQRLTYSYMAEGAGYGEAADKAYQALVGDKYEIIDTYRVPVHFDAGTVEDGADEALRDIDLSDIEVMAQPGLTPEFVAEQVGNSVRRDGYWVTTPGEEGLALFYNGRAMTRRNGSPIVYTFEDLIGQAAAKPIERMPESGAWGEM